MKKMLRVPYRRYYSDTEFDKLCKFLTRYAGCIDSLALFTDYSHHPYYPPEEIAELARILKLRVARLRELGFENVGLNILDTIGHMDEAWDYLTMPPFQTMVGHDGRKAISCMCPNTAEFKKYMTRKYELFAQSGADVIWVDDDIRMHHHTVSFACFCPACLEIFNTKNKTNHTRESLVARLNAKDGGAERKQWCEQNKTTICNLLEMVGNAARKINPNIKMGLMTSGMPWGVYSHIDFHAWFGALGATLSRPGGGYYSDDKTIALVSKAIDCQQQIAYQPDYIEDFYYELENFPYQRLSKSVYIATLECTAALMNGHTGVAFNVMAMENPEEIFESISRHAPFWDTLARLTKDTKSLGIRPEYNFNYAARRNVNNGNWFNSGMAGSFYDASELAQIGLPVGFYDTACCSVLAGDMADGFTDTEIEKMLRGGVLIDGKTFEILTARGFGEYLGAQIENTFDNGVYEVFTNSSLNDGAAGHERDVFMTFWGDDVACHSYMPSAPENRLEYLSELKTILGDTVGNCSYAFENKLGGRVVVMGYMPWLLIGDLYKREQYINCLDWLSRKTLPVVIKKCLKVVPMVRQAQNGDLTIMLTNCFLDKTEKFTLTVRAPEKCKVQILQPSGQLAAVSERDITRREGEIGIEIENIDPWGYVVLHITA